MGASESEEDAGRNTILRNLINAVQVSGTPWSGHVV